VEKTQKSRVSLNREDRPKKKKQKKKKENRPRVEPTRRKKSRVDSGQREGPGVTSAKKVKKTIRKNEILEKPGLS